MTRTMRALHVLLYIIVLVLGLMIISLRQQVAWMRSDLEYNDHLLVLQGRVNDQIAGAAHDQSLLNDKTEEAIRLLVQRGCHGANL